jgi:hypothetical protein
MLKIAAPVLTSLSNGELKKKMPVYTLPGASDREHFTYLEALGRTLAGMAPWLENVCKDEKEETFRRKYAELARRAVDMGTNPDSPDFMNFTFEHQPIVDAAFLASAILRAPNELYNKLDLPVKKNLISALKKTRTGRKPAFCNWLLFSAAIEAALFMMGEEDWDLMRIDYALRQHEQWYAGDGAYSDGPRFHWDYYNSFVIHPLLIDVTAAVCNQDESWKDLYGKIIPRARRYAAVLEKMISPEGTYPPVGRSLTYRFGAFQALSQIALLKLLPGGIAPEQVRCALTAVMKRFTDRNEMFDASGWLKIGMVGHQPDLGEMYISTGSLYLCTGIFLPLGLPSGDVFWSGEDKAWTSKKIWDGENIKADKNI